MGRDPDRSACPACPHGGGNHSPGGSTQKLDEAYSAYAAAAESELIDIHGLVDVPVITNKKDYRGRGAKV